ncbi:2-oxoglutarate and iron-dependent oxygenase JMJD4 isoform X2 [Xenopus laevis]|uniref:2-oxoglutarate and iron-dependent oxygenase JMJD4 n=1 Tax=Xenopus laevis TaxID=8355 RepID=A0A8J0VH11_XENLA|nr:2-oxoglutarate and iron-dependent oxygenase JMJD4 isoform X2 [Xenopus laevis]
MPPSAPHQIDFIEEPQTFPYGEFFNKYLLTNSPCLFSAEFTQHWGSRKTWVTEENKPNWDHLLENFGNAIVPVANCNVKEYNANPKEQIPLCEFISYWRDYIEHNYHSPKGCLYLKDWHMSREFPKQNVYETPEYFTSDWLNEYWDSIDGDDYRFVYMGPKGSWTPFHADVFRSYSWSANVCGRKKWLLFPPGEEEDLRDSHRNLPYDVTSTCLRDTNQYPNFSLCCQPIEVIQEAGEVIFIPSGWHHQVYNLEDTISINHNWINGCNVSAMWNFLHTELLSVEKEISEWREMMEDWHLHCQVIMKSCTGIDYKEFYTFLRIIAEKRLLALDNLTEDTVDGSGPTNMAMLHPRGRLHALFDLKMTSDVLSLLISNQDFQNLDQESLSPSPCALMQRLEAVITENSQTCDLQKSPEASSTK